MPKFCVYFDAPEEEVPPHIEGRVFRFPFRVCECEAIGTPRQTQKTRASRVDVAITGSQVGVWSLDDAALVKALYQIAKEHIQRAVSTSASLESPLSIRVDSETYPGCCPFDIDAIDEPGGAEFDVLADASE